MLYSPTMIDWYSVLFNSFWILGLAIMLATFSYHYWLAPLENRRLREQLDQPSFQRFFWLGFVFICLGLAGTSERLWEKGIWIIFLLIGIINAFKINK